MAAEQRVFFRDVKPYEVPDDLDTLQGPTGGEVVLSHSVLWSPGGGRVNLDRPGQRALAYRAVLSEGTVADQRAVLNKALLLEVWPDLMLPRRVREMWEARFPELCGSSVS